MASFKIQQLLFNNFHIRYLSEVGFLLAAAVHACVY